MAQGLHPPPASVAMKRAGDPLVPFGKPTYLLEIILGFSALGVANLLWFSASPGFVGVSPHPYWLVILPVASRYGFKGGLVAGLIAAAMHFGLHSAASTFFSLADFMQPSFWGMPILFISVGLILGEIRQAHINRSRRLEGELDDLKLAYAQLQSQFDTLSQVKREMDTRIMSQEQTLSTLHESAQALRSLEPEEVYPAVLDLVERFLSAEKASVYLLQEETLVLKAFRSPDGKEPKKQVPAGRGMMGAAVERKETASLNVELRQGQPPEDATLISAPIIAPSDGHVLGVLNIEKMPFLKYTPTSVKMATLIADWCAASLDNALMYEETREKLIADEITGAYTPDYLTQRLMEEFERARRYGVPLSLIYLEIPDFLRINEQTRKDVLKVFSLVLRNMLRKIDLLFLHGKPGKFVLLLPSTPLEGARIVTRKLRSEIEAFRFKPFAGEDTELTLTAGEACYTAGMGSPEELLLAAEKDALGDADG